MAKSEHWVEMTLGDFVKLQRGHDLPEQNRRPSAIPILGSFGITGWHDEAKARGPGVTIGRSGASFGVVSYSAVDYWPLNTALYVVDFHGNDERFAYYYLQSLDFKSHNSGSAQPSLNRNFIHPLPVRIPPVNEQHAIAAVLGALDDKIDQNRRTARTLERTARTIFQAWFVDFEPVKTKAAGATSFPSMPQSIFDSLSTRLIDSEIGPVPEGWEVKPIDDVVSVKGGATPSTKKAEYWEDGLHCWATPRDMSRLSHPVLLDTERRITDAGVECISSGLLPAGTVLMSSRAPVGYLAIAGVPTAINQGFIAMVCDGPLPPTYILQWAHVSMDAIHGRASGTTFPEISKKNFRPLPVVVPPPDVVTAFRSLADPLFDLLTATVKEDGSLAATRDYLLPRLLNGSVLVETGNG